MDSHRQGEWPLRNNFHHKITTYSQVQEPQVPGDLRFLKDKRKTKPNHKPNRITLRAQSSSVNKSTTSQISDPSPITLFLNIC